VAADGTEIKLVGGGYDWAFNCKIKKNAGANWYSLFRII
tara:strand:+ start:25 stop:141 length:117 start_codon:yes stop_codon:yes gene_type:complete